MQAHAVVSLLVAGAVATWAVVATLLSRRPGRDHVDSVGAVLLGVAAALGTIFVVLSTVAWLPRAEFLLPVVPSL